MGSRRFKPLIVLVLCLTALVLVRLIQIQVLEHETWAREAADLVRSSAVEPYRRGSILDRRGRPLATDEAVYRVQFRYRDFRRGHPLGQVAHAWSSLELRPVPLAEALGRLVPAGLELVQLTHAELDAFADGGALLTTEFDVPAAVTGRSEYRLTRRADVRFYVSRLLELDRRELLEAVRSKERFPSLLDYALSRREEYAGDRHRLLADLAARFEASIADLARLADELERGDLGALVGKLEGWRREVEDSTASELFREAAGFSLGRVDPNTVRAFFDLDWLGVLLRWDVPRLEEWTDSSRAEWFGAFDEYHRKRLAVLLELEQPAAVPDVVAGFWAERFLATDEGRRRRTHPLEVFCELDSLFERDLPRGLRAADLRVLPFEEPEVRAALAAGSKPFGREGDGSVDPVESGRRPADWREVARLELWSLAGASPADRPSEAEVEVRAADWAAACAEGPDRAFIDGRTVAVVAALEARMQAVLRAHLTEVAGTPSGVVRAAEPPSGRTVPRLVLSDGRLDRAEERAHSVLKDRGSRPFEVERATPEAGLGAGEYALIHLITRHPEAFAGFGARDSTRRRLETYLRDGEPVPYAAGLIGRVRAPDLRDLLEQRSREEQLARLREQRDRDELAISEVVRELLLVDEQLGGDGLEGHFEDELSGANGYRARRGMQELLASGEERDFYRAPEDGLDLVLTVDRDLQRAAQECLARPAEDPDPKERDYEWLNRPTGAIVLMRVNGDVLAAASFPDRDRADPFGRSSGSLRDLAIDRTLTAVGFQPPGSVFKPFVAAYALDRGLLDPTETMRCDARAEGPGAGYKSLRCHRTWGHGEIGLHGALMQSCNGYFAWLGEHVGEPQFQELANEFGFGRPTGVRTFPGRGGLREHVCAAHLLQNLNPARQRMAANGLGVITATPMQVARAYAGLATGRLPEVRLVDRVGDRPLVRRSREVGLAPEVLDTVHQALYDVANAEGGSAAEALSASELGFYMCAKTGSADISNKLERAPDGELRVRKHTWVAGWFPPKNPVAVVVVFVDDTLMTASKSSVWIARQFLTRNEVKDFVRAELGP